MITASLYLVFLLPVFIYSVLSPEWPSKMKNLIYHSKHHHPFQWLSIDLRVKLEHLTLACKTLDDLTPRHLAGWSFTIPYLTFCNLVILSLLQDSECILLSLTLLPLFKSCTVEVGLMKLKRKAQSYKRKLKREFQNRVEGSWAPNEAERASKIRMKKCQLVFTRRNPLWNKKLSLLVKLEPLISNSFIFKLIVRVSVWNRKLLNGIH